jgi:hypothetical protein
MNNVANTLDEQGHLENAAAMKQEVVRRRGPKVLSEAKKNAIHTRLID